MIQRNDALQLAGVDVDAIAAIHSVPATDANANGVPDAVE